MLSKLKLRIGLLEILTKELWQFLSCLPSLRILNLDLDADDNIPPIEDVPLFRDVTIGQLETLRVSSKLHPSEILFPKLFIDNQPSLKELEVDSNNVGTFSVLKALLLSPRYDKCSPDSFLGNDLKSLTILRIHTFSWISDGRRWSPFIDAIPGLQCLEILLDDKNRDESDDEAGDIGDYLLGLKTRIIEYGIAFDSKYDRKWANCTSTTRFVSCKFHIRMLIRVVYGVCICRTNC